MSAGGTMRAFHGVIGIGGVIVGWQEHDIREGDSRGPGQPGDQGQCGEYADLNEHGKQQGAAARAASAMELVSVAIDEA
ncbi:MAG: hypothetical protein QOJ41_279 [Acidobacteriaceae bacterium]|nr:hypothetical protein [Acidobacteriaceae bacterium]